MKFTYNKSGTFEQWTYTKSNKIFTITKSGLYRLTVEINNGNESKFYQYNFLTLKEASNFIELNY